MNKKGSVALELLFMLVTVVLTSAVVFTLVRADILHVKPQNEEISVLNTEFLPFGREGVLVVKEFQFCEKVDAQYNCLNPKEEFKRGEEVHFRFVVESSTVNGEVMLTENYRLKGPAGEVLLEVDEKNNFRFEARSRKEKESIVFADFFLAGYDLAPGEYKIDLVIENPLLEKKATSSKSFVVGR